MSEKEAVLELSNKVKKQFINEWEREHVGGYYNWTHNDDRVVEIAIRIGYNFAKAETPTKKQ